MMQPSCCARIAGSTARMQYSTPLRLISTSLFQPSSSMSAQLRFGTLMPALLTRRSMRPCLARICSAAVFTSAALLTSSAIASALLPLLVIFATTASSASSRRPDTTTVQPSAASASAPAPPAAAPTPPPPSHPPPVPPPRPRRFHCRRQSPKPRVSRYLSCKLSPLLCEGRLCYLTPESYLTPEICGRSDAAAPE